MRLSTRPLANLGEGSPRFTGQRVSAINLTSRRHDVHPVERDREHHLIRAADELVHVQVDLVVVLRRSPEARAAGAAMIQEAAVQSEEVWRAHEGQRGRVAPDTRSGR